MFSFTALTTSVDYIIEYLRAKEERQLENNVREILLELLEEPLYSKRSFSRLLEQSAIFDDDHNALRRQLIVLGARRYTSETGQELWGLKVRNVDETPEPPKSHASYASSFIVGVAASVTAALLIALATQISWSKIVNIFVASEPNYAAQLATYQPENCSIAAAEIALYVNGSVFPIDPVIFQSEVGENVVLVPAKTRDEALEYIEAAKDAADRFPGQDLAQAFVVDLRAREWRTVECEF